MGWPRKIREAVNETVNTATRPENYKSQQGNKATLCLADFTDENIFAELRRRGYSGELRYVKIMNVWAIFIALKRLMPFAKIACLSVTVHDVNIKTNCYVMIT